MADEVVKPAFRLIAGQSTLEDVVGYLVEVDRYLDASGPEGTNSESLGTLLSGQAQQNAQIDAVATSIPAAVEVAANAGSNSGSGMTLSQNRFTADNAGSGDTTNSVTITPTGGTSPYTYSWARISGDTEISADSASAATTTFSTASAPLPGAYFFATFRVTVTDDAGSPAVETADVSVSLWTTGGGYVGDIGSA